MTVADQSEAAVIAAVEKNASWSCGSVGYLVSTTWWNAWVQYSGYSGPGAESASTLLQLPGGGAPRPGPIANADLVLAGHAVDQQPLLPGANATSQPLTSKLRPEDVPLRPNLVEQQDFVIVSEASWNRLCSWYSGGLAIARRVVADAAPGPSGRSDRWSRVELYPLRVEVSYKEGKQGAQERTAVISIEAEASLAALKSRACAAMGVSEGEVELWDYSGGAAVRSLESPPAGEAEDAAAAAAETPAAPASAADGIGATGIALGDGPTPMAVESAAPATVEGAGGGGGSGSGMMEVDGTAAAAADGVGGAAGGSSSSGANPSGSGSGASAGYLGRSLREVALLDGQLLRLRRKDAPHSDSGSDDDDACGSDNDAGAPLTGKKAKAAKKAAAAAAAATGSGEGRVSAAQAAAAAALKRAAATATTPFAGKAAGTSAGGTSAPRTSGSGSGTFGGGSNNAGALTKRAAAWDDNVMLREGQLPGLAGLSNLGNTCFMASSLQCLAHAVPLMEAFLGGVYLQDLNRTNPLGMKGELAEAFGALMGQLWRGGVSSVTPRGFKAKIGRFAPQFSGYAQHDSQEFLAFLLDGLHEDTNRIKHKPYIEEKDLPGRPDEEVAAEAWANYRARNDSLVVDHFQGLFKSTVDCPQCGFNSVKFDPFMYLSLPLPESRRRVVEVVLVAADGSRPPARMALQLPAGAALSDMTRAAAQLAELPAAVLASPDSHLLPARPLRPSPSAAYDEVVMLTDSRMRLADALDAGGGGGGGGGYNLRSSAASNADPGLVLYYYPDAARGPRGEGVQPVVVHFKRPDCAPGSNTRRFSWSRDLWCGVPLVLYMEADRPPYNPDQVIRTEPSTGSSYGASSRPEYLITDECPLAAAVRTALRPVQKTPPPSEEQLPPQHQQQQQQEEQGPPAAEAAARPMEEDAPAAAAAGATAAGGDAEIVDAAAVAAAAAASAAAAVPEGGDEGLRPGTPVHDLDPESHASAAPSGRPSRTSSCGDGGVNGVGSRSGGGEELMEGLEPLVSAAAAAADEAAAGGDAGGDVDVSMPGTPQATPPLAMEEDVAAAALPAVMYLGPPPPPEEAEATDAGVGLAGGSVGPPPVQPFDMWAAQEPTTTATAAAAGDSAAAATAGASTSCAGSTFVLKLCSNKGDPALWGGVYEKDIDKEHHREFLLLFTDASSSSSAPASNTTSTAAAADADPSTSTAAPASTSTSLPASSLPASSTSFPTYSPELLDQPEDHPSLRAHRQRAAAGPQPVSLAACMSTFLQPERLAESDAWFCPRCKSHVCADKKLDLWSLPEVLVVHLKRFCYTRYSRNKLDTRVDFPLHGLDLGPYVLRPQGVPPLYDLFAVSNHYGSMGGGHYTAYAKLPSPPPGMHHHPPPHHPPPSQQPQQQQDGELEQQQQLPASSSMAEDGGAGVATAVPQSEPQPQPQDRWYCFDDSHVSQVEPEAVRSSAAYVLFYRRRAEAAADPPQMEELLGRLRAQREEAVQRVEQEEAAGAGAGAMADGPPRGASGSLPYGSGRQAPDQDQDQDQNQDQDVGKTQRGGGGVVSLAAAAAAAKASRRKKGSSDAGGTAAADADAEDELRVEGRSMGAFTAGRQRAGSGTAFGGGSGGELDPDLYGDGDDALPIAAPSSPMPVAAAAAGGGGGGAGRYDMDDYDAFVVRDGEGLGGGGGGEGGVVVHGGVGGGGDDGMMLVPQPPGSPQAGSPDLSNDRLCELYGDVEAMEVGRAGSDVGGLEQEEEMRSSDGGGGEEAEGRGAMLGRLLGRGEGGAELNNASQDMAAGQEGGEGEGTGAWGDTW